MSRLLTKDKQLDLQLEEKGNSRWVYNSPWMVIDKYEIPFICSWGDPFTKSPKTVGGKYKFPCLLPGLSSLEFHIDNYLYGKSGILNVIENKQDGEQNLVLSVDLFSYDFDIDSGILIEKMIFEESLDHFYDFICSENYHPLLEKLGHDDNNKMWKFYKLISLLQQEKIIPNISYIGDRFHTSPTFPDDNHLSPLKNPSICKIVEVALQVLESPKIKIKWSEEQKHFYLDYGNFQVHPSEMKNVMGSGGYTVLFNFPIILEKLSQGDIVVFSDEVLGIFNRLHPNAEEPIFRVLTKLPGIRTDYPRILAHMENWIFFDRGNLRTLLLQSRQFIERYYGKK